MALIDFLTNVRTAAGFLRWDVHAPSSSKFLESPWQQQLERAAIWLTPRTVEGFDADDFTFLPPDRREDLERHVASFRRIASDVPADGPASEEQIRDASGHFRAILELLEPYLSREWRVAYKALETVSLPEGVIGLAHDTTPDWNGDPMIWVWATVADNALTSDRSSRLALTNLLNQRIEKALRDHGITEPFSLGVWAASEMPEVIGSHAD